MLRATRFSIRMNAAGLCSRVRPREQEPGVERGLDDRVGERLAHRSGSFRSGHAVVADHHMIPAGLSGQEDVHHAFEKDDIEQRDVEQHREQNHRDELRTALVNSRPCDGRRVGAVKK